MKKRIFALFCTALLLAGCGSTVNDTEGADDQNVQQEETAKEEEMTAYLQGLPEEISQEAAVEEGFFTIADGAVVGGQEAWDSFMAAAEQGEEASVIVCQYSLNGGAMLDYLVHQKEGGYLLVSDISRDGYEVEDREVYTTQKFEVLKIFEDFSLQEGGNTYDICVLTNEAELDADTFRTYWTEMSTEAHAAYLLYVI